MDHGVDVACVFLCDISLRNVERIIVRVLFQTWKKFMEWLDTPDAKDLVHEFNFGGELMSDLKETFWQFSSVGESNL